MIRQRQYMVCKSFLDCPWGAQKLLIFGLFASCHTSAGVTFLLKT